ncbi:hypothetical protein ACFVH0_36740 [Streptomyces sp. NPDC127117]|uniref:hypothetical protein n=1 Tax=Streptomyces sp. NPDC127117 TaxID=3345368 RepID=UPI00363090D2
MDDLGTGSSDLLNCPDQAAARQQDRVTSSKGLNSESVNPFILNPKVRQKPTPLFYGISAAPLFDFKSGTVSDETRLGISDLAVPASAWGGEFRG